MIVERFSERASLLFLTLSVTGLVAGCSIAEAQPPASGPVMFACTPISCHVDENHTGGEATCRDTEMPLSVDTPNSQVNIIGTWWPASFTPDSVTWTWSTSTSVCTSTLSRTTLHLTSQYRSAAMVSTSDFQCRIVVALF